MAQANLKKKAIRLLLRAKDADDPDFLAAVRKLGWTKTWSPKEPDLQALLEGATNRAAESVIETLKKYQGEAQTRSPRLVAFQEYWAKKFEKQAQSSLYQRAMQAIEYSRVWQVACGEPGDIESRCAMYLQLTHQQEFDTEAARLAGLTEDEFNEYLKAALDDAHRRAVLRIMVDFVPADAHPDVAEIRAKMKECLWYDYNQGLSKLLQWADRERIQTMVWNPNFIFRFLREMEILRVILAKTPEEMAQASERFNMWQSSIEMVRAARFVFYGQVVS